MLPRPGQIARHTPNLCSLPVSCSYHQGCLSTIRLFPDLHLHHYHCSRRLRTCTSKEFLRQSSRNHSSCHYRHRILRLSCRRSHCQCYRILFQKPGNKHSSQYPSWRLCCRLFFHRSRCPGYQSSSFLFAFFQSTCRLPQCRILLQLDRTLHRRIPCQPRHCPHQSRFVYLLPQRHCRTPVCLSTPNPACNIYCLHCSL